MRTKRARSSREFPRRCDAGGAMLCRFCLHPVQPPRRTFCSDECVNRYLAATCPRALRAQVLQRDKGICVLCRFDALKVRWILNYLRFGAHGGTQPDPEAFAFYVAHLGIPAKRVGGALWDADHVRPVIEGGESTLENMRTLCIPCHRKVTYELTQRRVMRRKSENENRRHLQHAIG
jgi:5-methylcytosine-specific restriction endonuclease McrA